MSRDVVGFAMPLAVRIALALFGLAAAVYAGASISGQRFGEPPWWTRAATDDELHHKFMEPEGYEGTAVAYRERYHPTMPRAGREFISLGVGAVGLAVLGLAALAFSKPASASP